MKTRSQLLILAFFVDLMVGCALFGTISTLILYLVKSGLSQDIAYSIWKNYDVLLYVAALAGGAITGRYLSFRFACLVGMVSICVGYFLLAAYAAHSVEWVNIGLAFVACGAGLYDTNLKALVNIVLDNRLQRYNGFTFLHVGDILAQIIGPLALTYVDSYSGQLRFLIAGCSVLIGLSSFAFSYTRFPNGNHLGTENRKVAINSKRVSLVFLLALLSFSLLIMQVGGLGYVLGTSCFICVVVFTFVFRSMTPMGRSRLIGLVLLMFGMLVACICFRQIASVLNLFTVSYVNSNLFGWVMPTGYFQSVEPLFVLLFSPFFFWLWFKLDANNKTISVGTNFAIGLIILACAFGVLVVGTQFAIHQQMAAHWLILSSEINCFFHA